MSLMGTIENEYSFKAAWRQVPQGKTAEVRDKIMNALGLTWKTYFYHRMNGKVVPNMAEAKAIEEIFATYGITEIWGE